VSTRDLVIRVRLGENAKLRTSRSPRRRGLRRSGVYRLMPMEDQMTLKHGRLSRSIQQASYAGRLYAASAT
jgi:hypothetical protein